MKAGGPGSGEDESGLGSSVGTVVLRWLHRGGLKSRTGLLVPEAYSSAQFRDNESLVLPLPLHLLCDFR